MAPAPSSKGTWPRPHDGDRPVKRVLQNVVNSDATQPLGQEGILKQGFASELTDAVLQTFIVEQLLVGDHEPGRRLPAHLSPTAKALLGTAPQLQRTRCAIVFAGAIDVAPPFTSVPADALEALIDSRICAPGRHRRAGRFRLGMHSFILANRPSARERGYDRRWDEARTAFLRESENRFCRKCRERGRMTVATIVDPQRASPRRP